MTTASEAQEATVCSLSRNWWAFVVRGILALIIAVLAFLMPAESLLVLTLVFGAFSFADGVFSVIAAVRNIRKGEKWGWLAFSGILGVLTGIVVLVMPFVATLVLATFLWVSIAFWSIFTGTLDVAAAIRLRKEIQGEVWLILGGVLSIALGCIVVWLLLTRPLETFVALGWLLGVYATAFGISLIFLGLKLRKLQKAESAPSEATPA